jgi:hypothetical protein
MRRFLLFTSVAVALTVCTALAGKHQGGGGGGGKAAKAGGGGRGTAGMGQRSGGGARGNAFRGSQANGMRHEGVGQHAGRNAGQGKSNGAGRQGGATGQAMHSRGANGFRSANSTGVRHQALHSHAGFNRSQGFARVNRVHVQRYSVVARNYRAAYHYHERVWWNSHYSRIVLVGSGWYYWDAGYWYPAWGYDPAFQIYAYDGPIYSYDNLPPDQVIMNVQTELRFQGYYDGEIDGQLGPLTRQAIADYQRDKDLEVTEVADEPTVDSLGLA